MLENEIMNTIKAGNFGLAITQLKSAGVNINYCKDNESFLMIAIRNAKKNPAVLTRFVQFMLFESNFTLINQYHPDIRESAFDMALMAPVEPEVISLFVNYHRQTNTVECAVFSQNGLLKKQRGESNLGMEALKFEIVNNKYQRSINKNLENQRSGDQQKMAVSDAQVDKDCAMTDRFRDFAIDYAVTMDDPTILQRIDAARESKVLVYPDNSTSVQRAVREHKTRVMAYYNADFGNTSSFFQTPPAPARQENITQLTARRDALEHLRNQNRHNIFQQANTEAADVVNRLMRK